MTTSLRFGSSISKSYLMSLTFSNSPPSTTYDVSVNDDVIESSDDVDAIRWKLYGKNEEFRIMHDAATTIQSFWRGCFSRGLTSTKIQTLIEDIMTFRKLEAEYKKRDEEELQKQQQRHVQDHNPEEENGDNDDKQYSGLSDHVGSVRNSKNKPWRMLMEDNDCDDRVTTLTNSSKNLSSVSKRVEEEEEEERWATNHVNDLLVSVDDSTRGYRRYRTNIHGKNKTRPWRDDTSVFDAY